MREKIKKSISFFKDNLWPIAVLAVFLSLASWGFLGQGVVNFDEAYFSIVVRTFSEIARAAIFHPFSFFSGDFLSRLSDDYGNVYTAARPSYILASSFLALLMPAATALRVTSLLSALLLLIYFYRILPFYGLTGKRTRSLLTLLPAMSPLLLVYSRLGLSQIFSAAFLTVSFYYLLRLSRSGHRRDLIGFSLSLGVLFMSHYNVMFTVFFLAALAAFILVRSRARFSFWLTGIASFLSLPLL
jgi:4-amino-4-deoxy-L-arabinose transferase-like glycosyltransferase